MEILAQNKLEKLPGGSPGNSFLVGEQAKMTLWTYDADDPAKPIQPLPPDDPGRVWSNPREGVGGVIFDVPSEPNTRVIRFTFLKAKQAFVLSGTVNNATRSRTITVLPGVISTAPSIVIQKTVEDGVLPGILIGNAPTTVPLLVAWGISIFSGDDRAADYYAHPSDIGGTRSSVIRVSPIQVPGLDFDTRLGGRFLMQSLNKLGQPWTGRIYAEVWDASPNGVLLGVPMRDISGPL